MQPQLIIKTATGKEYGDSYRPEGYFSTAQLNAIAFSCFLGSALKTQGRYRVPDTWYYASGKLGI